ncbi:TNF receptor-associated factor homolog 1a-like isoform X3 [Cynara cardunculus var. scolymus]|uniref:TNF receptor-associated factor homolog 1a-like isoform X3 n=1 Tax=Cynara cardunculus var. scolymus TaxID=59895 RepID=UPI000D62515C|nr:TNF receptor-associated factor homolog 1a-like isoform X3 [Cynara cardunculus var. scolymus]
MAGSSIEESGVGRSLEGMSNGEALAEWRSSEQVENGITSTSPPYWDTDDDHYCGPKPSELYGKYTWKIDKFSQINKRELRSNAFEVGSYKWYILIYPQGCDVCNHLSLFLCVANHDKLLPGWSHFAQFTIAVVNKDPKKSKYSDTLHRFWKKEHDWGWKKFMELSKVLDGFVDADTLIIKAQVQVIRERVDRPFRCLDCQYRRELVRVYLSNVEQICRRFVEERRGRLGKLIEDKVRWSSFCTFWLGIDQTARRCMSREKSDSILKVAVKHFFIEKEVTSTLVMDSLYSGLKALEGQTNNEKAKGKCLDAEELPIPIVRVEKDTFILVDDVLLLLERAALEPLPPKDEKGPQNRTKDGGSGEDFSKDFIERDERRLTELGRRTIEIFVLVHIFSSKIEVAYQEAVALKRQEELIREEEAAWMTGIEQKTKRGASEKEKRAKKKQVKQKRNNRRQKDKGREEKPGTVVEDKVEQQNPIDGRKGFLIEDAELLLEKSDTFEDVSDVSDSINCVPEALVQPESDDRDSNPDTWEGQPPTEGDTNGVTGVHNGGRKSSSMMEDSSSTCSTDSLPSAVVNQPYKWNSPQNQKRGKGKSSGEVTGQTDDMHRQPPYVMSEPAHSYVAGKCCKVDEADTDVSVLTLWDRVKWLEQHKEVLLQKEPSVKAEVDPEVLNENTAIIPSSPRSPPKTSLPAVRQNTDLKKITGSDPAIARRPPSDKTINIDKANSAESLVSSRPHAHKIGSQKPTEKAINGQVTLITDKPVVHQVSRTIEKSPAQQVSVSVEKPLSQTVPTMLRPLSAPLVPGPRPTATTPIVSTVQAAPFLPRSVSAAGRLGPDVSPATQSLVPQSYRNAMMGIGTSSTFSQPHSPNLTVNPSHSYSQPSHPPMISAPMFLPQSSERVDSARPRLSFGVVNHDVVQNGSQWMESLHTGINNGRGLHNDPCLLNDIQNLDLHKSAHRRSQDQFYNEFPAGGRHGHGILADEFPHLDIINDLLDDEYGMASTTQVRPLFQSLSNGAHHHHLSRQLTYPGPGGIVDQSWCTSSCRFERSRHDEFQHSYGGGVQFEQVANNLQQQPQPYMIDGMIQNQWQMEMEMEMEMSGCDVSYPSMSLRNMDNDGYQYSNLMMGVNGYNTLYHPSSNGQ